jgi:hypothetical protein
MVQGERIMVSTFVNFFPDSAQNRIAAQGGSIIGLGGRCKW